MAKDTNKAAEGEDRFKSLEARLEASNQRLDRISNMALQLAAAREPAQTTTHTSPSAPSAVDFSNLPDPIADRAGFNKALADRVEQTVKARIDGTVKSIQDSQAAERQRVEAVSKLWNRFNEKHKDLGVATEIVQAQAAEVLTDAAQRGLDPERYMLSDPDAFIDTIADRTRVRMKAMGLQPVDAAAEAEKKRAEAEANAQRTGGIPGGGWLPIGNVNGADPNAGRKPSTMLEQIKEVQTKMKIV